jgi:hypothetical protein
VHRIRKIAGTIVIVALWSGQAAAEKPTFHHWELGAGLWAPLAGVDVYELDYARWDWLLVCDVGGEGGRLGPRAASLVRLHQLNPRQKLVIRLWPVHGFSGAHGDTFMDYQLSPTARERIDKELADQVARFGSLPNLYGYTFLEEIPGQFGGWENAPNKLPGYVEKYKDKVKAAYGKPLVWDARLRGFLMQRYWVPAINRIHSLVKKYDGRNRPIFFWHKVNTARPHPDGKPFYPYKNTQIIDGKTCDGFAACYVHTHSWFSQYTAEATRHGWPFFQQLSHPDSMRGTGWRHAVETVKAPVPGNLGYFFYGGRSPNREDPFSKEIRGKAGLAYRQVQPFTHPTKGRVIKYVQRILGSYAGMHPNAYKPEHEPKSFLDPADFYLPVTPGETLRYSFWLETLGMKGNEGFAMIVVPWDGLRTRLPNRRVFLEKPGPARKGRLVTGTIQVPNNVHSIWIWIGMRDAKGVAYLDDFSLETAKGVELVRNGAFEATQLDPHVAVKGWFFSDYFSVMPVQRNFCNQQGIGADVVYRYFAFDVKLSARRLGPKKIAVTAAITNTKKPAYYTDPNGARASQITAEIVCLPGVAAKSLRQPSAKLAPGAGATAQWELSLPSTGPHTARVIVTSRDRQHPTAPGYAELLVK